MICIIRKLIYIILFSWVAVASAGNKENERMQFADGLYARGMHKLAIKEYNGFLQDNPNSTNLAAAYFRLGECYRNLGNLKDAEKSYRVVFNKYRKSKYGLRAGCKRADLFMQIGDYDAALDLFAAVMAENPPVEIAGACTYFSGESLLKQKKTEDAVAAFEKIVKNYSASSFKSYALLKLGDIYATTENNQAKGLDYFKRAAEESSTDRAKAESVFQMAELYFRAKDYSKSADYYRQLLNKYPADARSVEARLQSGWAAYYAGMYAESLARARESLAKVKKSGAEPSGETAEWMYLKANSERQLRKNKDAVNTYAELIRLYPRSSFADAARYEKAVAFYKTGNYEQALSAVAEVNLDGKLRKDVYWLIAESSSALKQEEQAIQYYQLLVREFPESNMSSDAAYRLAYLLQERKDYKEAATMYLTVHAKFPEKKLASQSLFAAGLCQLQDNRIADAVRTWKSLIKEYPKSELVEKSLYQISMSEIKLKRDIDALTTLHELLTQFPETEFAADAYFWKGMLMLQNGKVKDAKTAFSKTLELKPREDLARDASFNLGLALKQLKQNEASLKQLYPLLTTTVSAKFTPQLLVWMAESFYVAKKYDKAISVAEILLKNNTDAVWQQTGAGLMGRSQAAKGKHDLAAASFRAVLASTANTRFAGEAALRLGEYSLANKDLAGAEENFSKAASLSGDSSMLAIKANAYAGLGRTAEEKGDFDAAARFYMSVAILYNDAELVPRCLAGAVRSFKKLGQDTEAENAVDELKKRYPDSAEAKKY
jgi:TolA-binding protein